MATPDNASLSDKTGTATPYQMEIQKAQRRFKSWFDAGAKCWKFYSKEKESQGQGSSQRRYALYWANIQVLQPAIYSRIPEPVVQRRFKDKDDAGRLASEIMQRCLVTTMDQCEFNDIWEAVRDDNLIPGRGTARVRYVPTFEETPEGNMLTDEKAMIEFMSYDLFLHGQADKWGRVPWVAFGEWLSKKAWKKAFPKVEFKPSRKEDAKSTDDNKTLVWEYWDKRTGKVCFVSMEHHDLLVREGEKEAKIDPYLDFSKFWPCPKPFYATLNKKDLIPQPDRRFYQDQLEEIDKLTNRIAKLEDALKFVGFYAGGGDAQTTAAFEKAFGSGVENEMIAVQGWSAMTQSGGVDNLISYLPTEKVAQLLIQCVELRRQLIEDVYQITGISDLARGMTDPRETLGAQQLKSQYSSIRVSDRQKGMERFIAECLQLTAEIIAENFQEETIAQMTGLRPTQPEPNPQTGQIDPQEIQKFQQDMMNWQQAIQLLRNDKMRGFRISVETDSTIQPNEQADKAARIEYLGAVGQFVQSTLPVVQQAPELTPLVGQMLLFTTRTFRAGRELEDEIEMFVDKMNEQVKQAQENPEPPPPSDEEIRQQGETQRAQIEAQKEVETERINAEKEGAKAQADIVKAQAETAKAQLDLAKTAQQEADAQRAHELNLAKEETQRQKLAVDQQRIDLEQLQLGIEGELMTPQGDGPNMAERIQETLSTLSASAAVQSAQMDDMRRTILAPREVERDPETGRVVRSVVVVDSGE